MKINYLRRAAWLAAAVLQQLWPVAVLAVLILAGSQTIFPDQRDKRSRAFNDLHSLAKSFERQSAAIGLPLRSISGTDCSDCPCKGVKLADISNNAQCAMNWNLALSRLFIEHLQQDRVPVRFARDPWGAPYLLHEGAGDIQAVLASAGPDGAAGTADDIKVFIVPQSKP